MELLKPNARSLVRVTLGLPVGCLLGLAGGHARRGRRRRRPGRRRGPRRGGRHRGGRRRRICDRRVAPHLGRPPGPTRDGQRQHEQQRDEHPATAAAAGWLLVGRLRLGLGDRLRRDDRRFGMVEGVGGEAGADRGDEGRLHLAQRHLERVDLQAQRPLEERGRERQRHLVHLQVVVSDGHPDRHAEGGRRLLLLGTLVPQAHDVAFRGNGRLVPHGVVRAVDLGGSGFGAAATVDARLRGRRPRPGLVRHAGRRRGPRSRGTGLDVLDARLVDHQTEPDVTGAGLELEAWEPLTGRGEPAVDLVAALARPAHVLGVDDRALATDGEHAGIVPGAKRVEQPDRRALGAGPVGPAMCHVRLFRRR